MTENHDTTFDGDDEIDNSVDAIARLIHAAGQPTRVVTAANDGTDEHIAHYVIPDGHHVETIDERRDQSYPHRKTGAVSVHHPDSFREYVAMHKDDGATIYGDARQTLITAVLNDHERDSHIPGWGDHRVSWKLQRSKTFELWVHHNGRMMDQHTFAEFLEENAGDVRDEIVELDGTEYQSVSALVMREVAESLEARKSVDFKQSTRLHDGNVQLRYEETTDAVAGRNGEMIVPQVFAIGVPIFDGQDPWLVAARFRYRITREGLVVSYHLERLADVVEAAFQRAWSSVAVDGVPSLLATAPQPV
jgi:uncharacterized protein YfdQ (DUF2303 family)